MIRCTVYRRHARLHQPGRKGMPQSVKHNLVAGICNIIVELGIVENHAEPGADLVMWRIARPSFGKNQPACLSLCFGLMSLQHVYHLFGHMDNAIYGVL